VQKIGSNNPPTALGETSARAPRIAIERASSVDICLENLTLNLGQDPLSQKWFCCRDWDLHKEMCGVTSLESNKEIN